MFNVEEYNRYYNDIEDMLYYKNEILKHKNKYYSLCNQSLAKAIYDRLILTCPEATYFEYNKTQYICVTKKASIMLCKSLIERRNKLISEMVSLTNIIDLINA